MKDRLDNSAVNSEMDEQMSMMKSGMSGPVSRPIKSFFKWIKNFDLIVV